MAAREKSDRLTGYWRRREEARLKREREREREREKERKKYDEDDTELHPRLVAGALLIFHQTRGKQNR